MELKIRLFIKSLFVLFLLIVFQPVLGQERDVIVFSDDFNRFELGTNWIVSTCSGAMINIVEFPPDGRLHLYSPDGCGPPNACWVDLAAAIVNLADGFVEFDFDNGEARRRNDHTEVRLRYSTNPQSAYVAVSIAEDTYKPEIRQKIQLSYTQNGKKVVVAEQHGLLEPGRYRLSVIGNIAEFINVRDGTPIHLTGVGIPPGQGGLQIELSEEETWIDNLIISTPSIATCSNSIKDEDETGVDCGGSCEKCSPCENPWPAHEGEKIMINEENYACDLFEVTHPDLWKIVDEAFECCQTGCEADNCHNKCENAYEESGYDASKNENTLKKCVGLYEIYGFGPAVKFMKDYYWPEIECDEHGGFDLSIPCHVFYQEIKDDGFRLIKYPDASDLTCQGDVGQPNGWLSDTHPGLNSCIFSDLPAHASIGTRNSEPYTKGIHTGTCVDYSTALTTILRMSGYKEDEIYSVTAPGHEYNIIKFPGDRKNTIIDTTGNFNAPYNPGGLPISSYSEYCDYFHDTCDNDWGRHECPTKNNIYGCENEKKKAGEVLIPRLGKSKSRRKMEALKTDMVKVIKSVQESANIGETVTVNIEIENLVNEKSKLYIRELLGNAEAIQPQPHSAIFSKDRIAMYPPFFEWQIELEPFEKKTVSYEIRPISVGDFMISPTFINIENSESVMIESLNVEVYCNANRICDSEIYETYLNCPSDCPTGTDDGICDGIGDGKCDPDCLTDSDFDCIDKDRDKDNIPDSVDNCPDMANSDQKDYDLDGIGDACESFIRGDTNFDNVIDIADPINILNFLFADEEIKCRDAADVNDDGKVDIADPIYLLSYIFVKGNVPKPPFPNPGIDLTEDGLDC